MQTWQLLLQSQKDRRNRGINIEGSEYGSNLTNIAAIEGPYKSEEGVRTPPNHELESPSAKLSNDRAAIPPASERTKRPSGTKRALECSEQACKRYRKGLIISRRWGRNP